MSKILGIHTPYEIKNYAINGAFDFWQEKVGNTTTVNQSATHAQYASDMALVISVGPTNKNFSYVRSTDVPTAAQSGFQAPYSLLFTMITGIPSFAAADSVQPFQYRMEGSDFVKIHQRVVTYGFWIKTSASGTYNFSLTNAAETRSYVTTFSVSNPNTWEYKTITVQMDQGGTWAFDTNSSLVVRIGSVQGSTFQTATLNTWQTGAFYGASTATNWQATSGATFRVTQFSIVEGSFGFGATGFQRAGKNIQQELTMCQRYYEKTYQVDEAPGTATGAGKVYYIAPTNISGAGIMQTTFKVSKRASPTGNVYNSVTGAINSIRNESGSVNYNVPTANLNWNQQALLLNYNSADNAGTNIPLGGALSWHWVADARL